MENTVIGSSTTDEQKGLYYRVSPSVILTPDRNKNLQAFWDCQPLPR